LADKFTVSLGLITNNIRRSQFCEAYSSAEKTLSPLT
jgi:hypothetical protein